MFRGMLLFFSCLAGQRQCLRCNRDVKPPCVRETFFFEICSWFALALGSRGRVRFFSLSFSVSEFNDCLASIYVSLRIQRVKDPASATGLVWKRAQALFSSNPQKFSSNTQATRFSFSNRDPDSESCQPFAFSRDTQAKFQSFANFIVELLQI